MNNKVVYRHITLDTNQVFYIGIGKVSRPKSKNNRNKFWQHVVNKHGYYSEVLKDNLSHEEACELEELLILEYGRRDLGTGYLVNMTDGGDGLNNYKFDRSIVEKIREKNIGRKHSLQQNLEKSLRQQGQRGKKIIDSKTQIIYRSIVIASKETGIPKTTLRRYLINNSNKTTLKFLENG